MPDLERFVTAQDGVWSRVMSELSAGQKRSHWMWFVFPQIEGLGRSATAQLYAIRGQGEAQAYLAHPVLGERLRLAVRTVLPHAGRGLRAVFGTPDDMKFRSSMTLFDAAAPNGVFAEAVEAFGCERDPETLKRL